MTLTGVLKMIDIHLYIFTKSRFQDIKRTKALYSLYRKIRNMLLPIDIQLKLFDVFSISILLYCAEVWGFENIGIVEKIHLQFCKKILNTRNSTANYMVYGEIGRFPLEIEIKVKMIMFWFKTNYTR